MLKGNRGEWSEVYAFLRILADGEIEPADANLNVLKDEPAIPVVRIIREEKNSPRISYYAGDLVQAKLDNGEDIARVESLKVSNEAESLYREIVSSHTKGAFAVPLTEEFMDELGLHTLKAPSKDKSDIVLQIHDVHTGFNPICGWSIKSELGNPPTLLNAGATTNFVFRIRGCSQEIMEQVNAINTSTKLKDRISLLRTKCELVFERVAHSTFDRNMRLIDSFFPQLMANAVLRYYSGEGVMCSQIVESMEREDTFGMGSGMYEYKFKKFLCASALGMTPAKEWSGRDDATGGYVIVRDDGKVLAFHIYNRDMFEDYLLGSTKFETASTSRHGFGSVYEEDGEFFINLNLQIRFR